MARWIKKGLIFEPPDTLSWMKTHAALPVAVTTPAGHRIYFSGRDEQGRAQIGTFEFNINTPGTVVCISESPVISPGTLGTFDDSGVTNSWLVSHKGRLFLYYTGWTLGVTVPFYYFIGLAVSDDNGKTFQKVSNAPILDRNRIDPYLTASPCVIIDKGLWRMWYVSGTGWETEGISLKHYYHIKYAESSDGIHWKRAGFVCIDYQSKEEYAISRPCIIQQGSAYRMWYAFRGAAYRIGYAESSDGIAWERKDQEAGIDVSSTGWDSEMIEYPFVFVHQDTTYMLYNGNDYGRTGIGLAVLAHE